MLISITPTAAVPVPAAATAGTATVLPLLRQLWLRGLLVLHMAHIRPANQIPHPPLSILTQATHIDQLSSKIHVHAAYAWHNYFLFPGLCDRRPIQCGRT